VEPNSNWNTSQIGFHSGLDPLALRSSGSYVKMNMINYWPIGTVNKKHASKFQTMYSQTLLIEQKIVKLLFRTIVSWRKTAIVDFPSSKINLSDTKNT
jgi:hypothetical protein